MKPSSGLFSDVHISVIIPTCLRNDSLRKAINSVLNQTFQEFEIIVVNDSSNDKEVINILEEFKDSRIKYFSNSRTKGANGARNTGIIKAKGKYISMLDDDDIFLPTKLEKQYIVLENNSDFGIVTTQADVVNEKREVIRTIDDEFCPEDIFYNLIFNNCVIHCSVMFRKEIVVEAGLYNENLNQAQDYDLWSRIIRIAKFFQINEKLVLWREHAGSITGEKKHFQKMTSIYLGKENVLKYTEKEISPVTISKLQDQEYKNISELKEAISLFRSVYESSGIDSGFFLRNIKYEKKLLRISMQRKIELSLYFFFVRQPKVFYIGYFLLLSFEAKKILIKKLIQHLARITRQFSNNDKG